MKTGRMKYLCSLGISLLLAVSLVGSVFALDFIGTGSGSTGGTGDVVGKDYTLDFFTNCVGYRFSYVNSDGEKYGPSIDVIRDADVTVDGETTNHWTTYKKTSYNKLYLSTANSSLYKMSKKQLVDIYKAGTSTPIQTTGSSSYAYGESSMGFSSSLPYSFSSMASGLASWQNNVNNLNACLKKMSSAFSVSAMNYGDMILIEPIVFAKIAGVQYAATLTECWMIGGSLLGYNRQFNMGGSASTYDYIAFRMNSLFPSSLYIDETTATNRKFTEISPNFATKVFKLASTATINKFVGNTATMKTGGATFGELISQGFGVGVCYAKTEITFDVEYYLDGVKLTDPIYTSQTNCRNNVYYELPVLPVKSGYTVTGWYLNPSYTGTRYDEEDSFVNSTNALSGTMLITTNGGKLKWYAKSISNPTYTVNCDMQGGSGGTSVFYEAYKTKFYTDTSTKSAVTKITVPTRTGYTFGGYYTSPNGNGTQTVKADGSIAVRCDHFSSNTVIYAKWTPNVHTVTCSKLSGTGGTDKFYEIYDRCFVSGGKGDVDLDGYVTSADARLIMRYSVALETGWSSAQITNADIDGNGTIESADARLALRYSVGLEGESDHRISRITVPTKTGYVFGGYYTAVGGTGTNIVDPSGLILVSNVYYTGNATVYAKWIPNSYTVKYYLDGVEQTSLRQTCKYGTVYAYKALPAKTDYLVTGWNTKTDMSGTTYTAGSSFSNLTSTDGEVINLYATSKLNRNPIVTVHMYLNGSVWTADNPDAPDYYGTKKSHHGTIVYSKGESAYDCRLYKTSDDIPANTGGYYTASLYGSSGYIYRATNIVPGTYYLAVPNSRAHYAWYGGSAEKAKITVTSDMTVRCNYYSIIAYVGSGIMNVSFLPAVPPENIRGANNDYKATTSSDGVWGFAFEGSTLTLSALSETFGYDFDKWERTDGGGTQTVNTSKYTFTVTGKREYTAYGKLKEYAVVYNANGGSGAPASQIKKYGIALTLSTTKPTRTGYTFNNWSIWSSGGGTTYAPGAKYTDDSAVILYAQWTPNKYTISYNANGGSGAPSAQTKQHDTAVNLSYTTPTRTGYTFNCWNTKADGSGTAYAYGAKYTANASVTLYAQWNPNRYTVTYYANGGSGAPSSQTKYHGTNLTLSNVKPTRTGYTFNGWNTNSSGTGTNYDSGGTYSANANVSLYAKWTIATYTVKYDANGGSGSPANQTKTYGKSLTLSSTKPTRAGYIFNGWNTNSSGTGTNYSAGGTYTSNANLTLYAKWTPISYTVKYYLDGAEQTSLKQTCTYGTSYTYKSLPTKTGYTVGGWWSGNSSSSKGAQYTADGTFSNLTTANGGTVSRYAYSTPVTYTVEYNANSGSGAPAAQTKTYGISLTLSSTVPTKTGYTFNGWNTNSSGTGTNYSAGGTYTSNANITLYAKWTPISYSVKFNGNGNTSGTMPNQSFTYDTAQNLTANAFKRSFTVTYNYNGNGTSNTTVTANSTFAGWATSATGSKVYNDRQSVTNLSSTSKAVVSIYAVWNDMSVTLPTPTRTGYIFSGWYTSSSGGTKVGSGGASYTPSANITLYAQWTPITYMVKYNGNGNTSGSTALSTHTYDVSKALTTNGFTKTGYKFVNWNTKADGSGTSYTDKQSVKNLTAKNGATVDLYAQWEEDRKLSLEAVTPNAAYREGTEVITSFNIINEGTKDCIPSDNVSVVFKVYKDSTVIKTVTKNNVIVPGNDKNLIYFKWTVPENIGGSTIYVSGEIVENGSSYSLVKNAYETTKYVISSTPDTQYEIGAPSGFTVPSVTVESNNGVTWTEWTYSDGAFKKVKYGIGITSEGAVITPDASANATKVNGKWVMKSGYGFGISVPNGVRALDGCTLPATSAYTKAQYVTALFPEFSYLTTINKYRTLELSGNNWIFGDNADYGKIHFTPLWYPDGSYTVSVVQSDMWTPAGMLSRQVNTNTVTISGSAYDDWYI